MKLRLRSFSWGPKGLLLFLSLLILSPAPSTPAVEHLMIYTDTQSRALPVSMMGGAPYVRLLDLLSSIGNVSVIQQSTSVLEVRLQNHTLFCRPNSTLVAVDGSITSIGEPILMRGAEWLIPTEFISRVLPRLTDKRVTFRTGALRAFITTAPPPRVFFDAKKGILSSRLAVEVTQPVPFEIQRAANGATILMGSRPLDPGAERLNYSDDLIKSIVFDDADGRPKIRITISNPSFDLNSSITQGGLVFLVSLTPAAAALPAKPRTVPSPPQAPGKPGETVPATPTPTSPVLPQKGVLRIVTIDPGHGGADSGARSANDQAVEKYLTLQIAQRTRYVMQQRLGLQVFLTREKDMDLSLDQRAIIANTDHSDVFISLHVGYSLVQNWNGARVYVYSPASPPNTTASSEASSNSAATPRPILQHRYFRPWESANADNFQLNEMLAEFAQSELSVLWNQEAPPPRMAPLRPLGNVVMPALLVEVGNLNSDADVRRLLNPQFQTQIAGALTNAVQRFIPVYEAR